MIEEIQVRTWLDALAARLGGDRLVDRLRYDISPSVLLVSAFLFVDAVVLQLYKELTGGSATVFQNPFWLVVPVGMLGAVLFTRTLQRRYRSALAEIHIEQRTARASDFESLIDDRLRWGLFVVGAVVILVNSYFFIGASVILRTDGLAGLFGNFVVVPFVYVPVAVDFIATYLGLQLVLPRRIRDTDLELDFLDPQGLGGLRPLGELVKHSYYYVMLGLAGFAVFIYGPWVFDGSITAPVKPSPLIDAVFTVGWVAAVGALAHALYVFHRFMNRQKREKLFELDRQYRDLIDGPWDIATHKRPETERERIEELENRMDRVTNTREYPATFAMWTQLLVGIILPKGIQLLLVNL
ncbi:hypothetical protein [Haloarcula salina]|uniref:Uncharacterized protein n=1 Tax=Haloarcula salina TaxID=1429914 RepID=A0AA41G5A4_9EURY|nr:hypothetical protein [Haloarcula salina]MBV0903871.1 hypothetical protein [Haloarcula salina]